IDSGDWVRGQAVDVLQAILAQDPSNEWARDQFRRLSTPDGADSTTTAQTPPSTAVSRPVHTVIPPVTPFLPPSRLAILAFFFPWATSRSPLSRALASRVPQPSTLSGDVAHISIAAVMRTANDIRMTGMLTVKSAEGRARVYLEYGDPIHCEAF